MKLQRYHDVNRRWMGVAVLCALLLLLVQPTLAQDDVPDRLLFVGNFEGQDYEVYTGDLASQRMRALTADEDNQTAAIWSPDATQVLYRTEPTSQRGNNLAATFSSSVNTASRLVLEIGRAHV